MANPSPKPHGRADHEFMSLAARIVSLKARDVMTREPVVLSDAASLSDAVATLQRHAITGCPVVDQRGRLIGMFSLWDIARATEKKPAGPEHTASSRSSQDIWAANETVKDRMSRCVGTASETQSLVDVARTMCREHWHRLPVVAHDQQLKGIISTMDVLAALVNAFDESASERVSSLM
jgi:CBS-domain-containing membrane protein